jgi:hypothetical protein
MDPVFYLISPVNLDYDELTCFYKVDILLNTNETMSVI